MKSCFNRALALMISLLMIFTVASPAFAYECAVCTYGNWKITKIATCEEKGEMARTCTRCGKVETIATPEEHNIEETVISADCTKGGYKKVACATCGEVIEESELPALEHTFGTAVTEKEATCTEDGLTDKIFCARCEEVISEQTVIPAFGHENVDMPRVEPTCTEKGLTEGVVCKHCGLAVEKSEEIPAKGHTPVAVPAVPST